MTTEDSAERLIECLRRWNLGCAPSLQDSAVIKAAAGEIERLRKDAGRYHILRSLKNESFGEVLAEEAFSWQVPLLLIETGDIDAILDYMARTKEGLDRIDAAMAQVKEKA